MLEKLRGSVVRFGIVENLVVRPLHDGSYEVVSGNQRLRVCRDLGMERIPCMVVELDDVEARLLAQALNQLQGDDDLGLKAELVRRVLADLPRSEVLAVLPETSESLTELASLGQEDLAEHLRAWQAAQKARLRHLQFQLTQPQLGTVQEALALIMPQAREAQGESPNARGTALYLLCKAYMERDGAAT